MQRLLLSLLSMAFLSSCGVESQRSNALPDVDVVQPGNLTFRPLLLTKQSSQCLEKSFEQDGTEIMLNLFLSGTRTTDIRKFFSLFNGNRIRGAENKIISQTLFSVHEETIPRGDMSYIEVIRHDKGREVTICPEEVMYERNTIESAALNASYFISKTSRAVVAADKSVNLPAIKLIVSPKIKVTFRPSAKSQSTRTGYRADNAYYNPIEKSITFLPHSQEWRDAGITASFWEVPMVGSHEYGHHIFQTLVSPYRSGSAIQNVETHCFGKNIVENSGAYGSNVNDKTMILSAYNEGFSDLISYYSLSDLERSLTGVTCLEVSRDVGSATFYDGVAKKFSTRALLGFLSPLGFATEPEAFGCQKTNFQSIHNIGAIFAHNADKIVSSFSAEKEEKLSVTLAWAKNLAISRIRLNSLAKERYMQEIFILYVRTAASVLKKEITPATCALVESSYQGLTTVMDECR